MRWVYLRVVSGDIWNYKGYGAFSAKNEWTRKLAPLPCLGFRFRIKGVAYYILSTSRV